MAIFQSNTLCCKAVFLQLTSLLIGQSKFHITFFKSWFNVCTAEICSVLDAVFQSQHTVINIVHT